MTRIHIGAFFSCASFLFAYTSSAALAQLTSEPVAQVWPTRIVPVLNAPITITKCSTKALTNAMVGNGSPIVTMNSYNRSSRHMISYTVKFTMYDHDGNVMGKPILTYKPKDSLPPHDLDEGEQAQLGGAFSGIQLSEPISSLSRVSCRMEQASFEGNRTWTYGRAWNGPLGSVPVVSETLSSKTTLGTSMASGGSPSANMSNGVQSKLHVSVVNTWNDKINGSLYIHTSVEIQGGASDTTLRPANVALVVALANGSNKQYLAMETAAPTYEKFNPLGNTTQTTYEVDPKDDLGHLGSIVVPAHGLIKIVTTFLIGTDVVANPNENRNVTVR